MKLQIFSDVHMEAYHSPTSLWKYIKPQADIAIVAGDIDARKFEETISEIADKFETVICTLGNHSWYHKDINWRPDASLVPSNVHILDSTTYVHEDVVFVGSALWSDFKNEDWFVVHSAQDVINDFHAIGNGSRLFTARDAAILHKKEKAYIKHVTEENRGKKIVIVTHFIPSYIFVHEKWKRGNSDLLNYYFSSSCDDLIETCEAKLWVFGHTHDRVDKEVCGTRFVCNPLGYPRENNDFTDMVVEI